MDMKYNDFNIDLEYSLEERENEMFDRFYYRIFPHLKKIDLVTDKAMQLKGIDKILTFENGNQLTIDEKKRRSDYGDVLLEEYSNYEMRRIGWLGRDKYTDYIVYGIMPAYKVYIFPFLILQLAWIENYNLWLTKYGRKFAPNKGYRTSNIPVPSDILLNAIRKKMLYKVEVTK